jgi:hypothetical protein
MMIDMHGPDIEAVDEGKALILEFLNAFQELQEEDKLQEEDTRCTPTERERTPQEML